MTDKCKITFTKDAWEDIRSMFKLENPICHFCKEKITEKNVGGIFAIDKVTCSNSLCLLAMIKLKGVENDSTI